MQPFKSKHEHKPKMGAPTLYKEEYCDDLVDHMRRGYSFESFAAIVECHRDTLYEWVKVHPDFSDAKQRGTDYCRLFWEQKGIEGLFNTSEYDKEAGTGSSKSMNAALWIFNMKNRFPDQWKDKREVENSGQMGITWNEEKTYENDEAEQETNEGT